MTYKGASAGAGAVAVARGIAGQVLGAVSVFVGRWHARMPAYVTIILTYMACVMPYTFTQLTAQL